MATSGPAGRQAAGQIDKSPRIRGFPAVVSPTISSVHPILRRVIGPVTGCLPARSRPAAELNARAVTDPWPALSPGLLPAPMSRIPCSPYHGRKQILKLCRPRANPGRARTDLQRSLRSATGPGLAGSYLFTFSLSNRSTFMRSKQYRR